VEFFSGEDENMGTFMAAIEQQSGFRLEEHWLQLFGVCTNCRQSG
jgi:Fe2+ or Zn2+ uptake regulation protein